MRLDGVHMLVTSAEQGIGREIALMAASYGADLSIVGRDIKALTAVQKEINGLGRKCSIHFGDITDYEYVKEMVYKAEKELGRINVLVNNVSWDSIGLCQDTAELIEKIMKTTKTTRKVMTYCSQAVLESMKKNRCGKIINVSCEACKVDGESVYAYFVEWVTAYTQSLSKEVAKYNIKVNCVCPGPTDTPIYRLQPEKKRVTLERFIPLKKIASQKDIAGTVVFFAIN